MSVKIKLDFSVLFLNLTWYDNIRAATRGHFRPSCATTAAISSDLKLEPFRWSPLDFALYLLGLAHTLDSWLISASATLLRTASSPITISAVLIIQLFTDKTITVFLISGFNVTHVYLL